MLRIDAHQHFWKYDPVRDSWITEEMLRIRRDFFPEDLQQVLKVNNIDGCIAVQADQSEIENAFLLSLAEENDFIKGIVGWTDLQAANVEERLELYRDIKKLKGFRHILQGEPQRDLMLKDSFKRGISLLKKYNFTYDILIFPDQLQYTKKFVSEHPDQKFVIDHLAKPCIKSNQIVDWKDDIEPLAQYENLYCKISGFVTEADWKNWKKKDFHSYFDVVLNAFGTNRIMFGSDWPVCLVAAEYEEVLDVVKDYFSSFSSAEQEKIFGGNAIQFYNL